MPAYPNPIEKAFALLGIAPTGDDKVFFIEDDADDERDASRFAGFEGRFDDFAESLKDSTDQGSSALIPSDSPRQATQVSH